MKQATLMDDSLQQAVRTWRDYTYMANRLKMNTKNEQIAKPRDIKKAHDDAVITSSKDNLKKKAKEIEKKWPNVNKQLQKLKNTNLNRVIIQLLLHQKLLTLW